MRRSSGWLWASHQSFAVRGRIGRSRRQRVGVSEHVVGDMSEQDRQAQSHSRPGQRPGDRLLARLILAQCD